jgi:hypothetical protein
MSPYRTEDLDEGELWERLAAIEKENKRITELCGGLSVINMSGGGGGKGVKGTLGGGSSGGGNMSGGGGGGGGVVGQGSFKNVAKVVGSEMFGVVDGLGSLLLTTVDQAKVQRDKAVELRAKIEKQIRDRAVLQDLDAWCEALPKGGGAQNRSEWASRGFQDPLTGYGLGHEVWKNS